MAAKLEWISYDLYLGAFNLAYVTQNKSGMGRWRMVLLAIPGALDAEANRYETEDDCRQDLEREVRRLLREAGVEVS